MRLPTHTVWSNPIGLAILGLGAVTSALTATLPWLEPWSGRAGGVLLLAALAYVGTLGVYCWPRREASELRQIRKLRDAMVEQLAARRRAEPPQEVSPLTAILAEAVVRLDDEMIPAVAELIDRHELLCSDLARFRRGELVMPDQAALQRLRQIEARQSEAIVSVQQQVANAYAATLALAQEGAAEAHVVTEAQRWSQQLIDTQATLAELLDESGRWERLLEEQR